MPPSWVQQRMPECAEPLQALILQARAWKQWALHSLPVPRHWTRGPIALLGDAAHPVLPFLAQGGVMALEDAVVVADALHRFTDVTAALKWYQQPAAAARHARCPCLAPQRPHLSPVGDRKRRRAIWCCARVPPQRLMARYDWLYGWRCD